MDAESPDHPEYAGWLSIPYLTRAGVVSFKFRTITGPKKYVGPYESRLYNTLAMDRADRLGTLAICEGEIDTITLDALVGLPAVGIPGVKMYKAHPEWRELFRGYQEVLIFQDNDEPRIVIDKATGEETLVKDGEELAKALRKDIDTARIVHLPGKDVNDTYLEHGGREGILKAARL